MTLSADEIIAEQAKKDTQFFGELFDRYYSQIYGFLLKKTSHQETAKDLTSETFFQALKNLKKFQPRGEGSFKCWLFAIAVAQANSYFRHQTRWLSVTLEESPELVAEDSYRADNHLLENEKEKESREQTKKLRLLIRQLNIKQQSILDLRYLSNFSTSEIAKILHMKESTVRSHLHRATNKLRVLWSKDSFLEKKYEPIPRPQSAPRRAES